MTNYLKVVYDKIKSKEDIEDLEIKMAKLENHSNISLIKKGNGISTRVINAGPLIIIEPETKLDLCVELWSKGSDGNIAQMVVKYINVKGVASYIDIYLDGFKYQIYEAKPTS